MTFASINSTIFYINREEQDCTPRSNDDSNSYWQDAVEDAWSAFETSEPRILVSKRLAKLLGVEVRLSNKAADL